MGFRCSYRHTAFDADQCLLNSDQRTIFTDMPWLQTQQFLSPHTGADHQTDTPTDFILGKLGHQQLHFVAGEGFFPFHRIGRSHLLGEAHRVLVDQIVGFCFVEDLEQHAATLGNAGVCLPLCPKALEELLHMHGFDIVQLHLAKLVFQMPQGVLVAFFGGGCNLSMLLEPNVSPLGECVLLAHVNTGHFLFPVFL